MTNEKYRTGPENPARRNILIAGAALAAASTLGTSPASAQTSTATAAKPGRRMLGNLEVSEIGLGVQNNARTFTTLIPNRDAQIDLIRAAYDQGVTFFDCAEFYGPHECERILGEAVASFRDDIQITTKFGFDLNLETGAFQGGLNSRPDHIKQAVEGCLRRLNTDRVDLLYQHRVDPSVPIEDVAGAVRDLMDEGKVLHWGLSEMGINTLRRAHAELPLAAVQNEYSMFYRGVEAEVLPVCAELGIGFVPFAPLGYGFLTGAIDAGTTFAPGDFRANTTRVNPDNLATNLALVELLKEWANRKSARPGQIALAWLLAQGSSVVPIPGTTQIPHLIENSSAASVTFTEGEITELTAALDAIEIQGDRMPEFVMAWSNVDAPLPN